MIPTYEEIQTTVNCMTCEINDLVRANNIDREMLEIYRQSLSNEQSRPANSVDTDSIARIYKEAGVVLTETVLHRIEDVNQYHKTIIANRHAFLSAEVERLKDAISDRKKQIQKKITDANILEKFKARNL